MKSVLQPWVCELSFMQQTVLITGVRGPDGCPKDHPVKKIIYWYRRSVLYSAMDHSILENPWVQGGGKFTRPWPAGTTTEDVIVDFIRSSDDMPHHWQLHMMHGAQILGYKHPHLQTKSFWFDVYRMKANDMHLHIETESEMNKRLGDNEEDWRASVINERTL